MGLLILCTLTGSKCVAESQVRYYFSIISYKEWQLPHKYTAPVYLSFLSYYHI